MPKRGNDHLVKLLILINKNISVVSANASLWTIHQNEDAIMTIIVTLQKMQAKKSSVRESKEGFRLV
jgi:hypothetical protein